MDLAGAEWRLIREEARAGPLNMALDEVAAETAASGGPGTLRLYRWEPSTLSLGYHQAARTVDWDYCEAEGVTVTRRPTGGGGIYHDAVGDISYSIVLPAAAVPGKLMESYHTLLVPVFDGFERMGVDAEFTDEERPPLYEPACYLRGLNPAHDVVVGGRKISGNAQRRTSDTVIQHGSIMFARRADRHLAVFDDPGVTPGQFERRVTSIREEAGIGREHAVEAIESALAEWAGAENGSWTDAELETAREVAAERFTSEDWTRRR